jgi:hypothetical protein
MKTVGNFKPDSIGVCLNCGREIGWHAGTKCFGPDTKGIPRGVTRQMQEWRNAALFLKGE